MERESKVRFLKQGDERESFRIILIVYTVQMKKSNCDVQWESLRFWMEGKKRKGISNRMKNSRATRKCLWWKLTIFHQAKLVSRNKFSKKFIKYLIRI